MSYLSSIYSCEQIVQLIRYFMSKDDNSNLYEVLERGDRGIDQSTETAILLVGLTRAGKSTTFNWILGKHIIGVGDEVEAHYENVIKDDAEAAQLGDTFTSVTLPPNVVQLNKKDNVTLIDMAGYKDKRNYIGVIGVSYFLKAVFERIKKVKFLIVIGEDRLSDNSGDGIISTFNGFINMFNFDLMTPQIKKRLYESISIVVTRSQNKTKHYNYLKRISRQLKDAQLIVDKKEEVVGIIDHIIGQSRIQAFDVATHNQTAPPCELIEYFDSLGWKFFDIADASEQISADIISLPFQKQYQELKKTPEESNNFNKVIETRVNSYLKFSKILNALISNIKNNWNNTISQWEATKQLSLSLTKYDEVFDIVRHFLEANDFYKTSERIPLTINLEKTPLNLVQTIKKVLEIYTIADIIGDQTEPFLKNMQAYAGLFERLIDCFMAFSTSNESDNLLIRLKFIIKRGFREFSKLYQLNSNIIHDVNQKMKDNCNLIFDETRKIFIQRFITKIDSQLMAKLFTKIGDLLEYEEFFNDYQTNWQKEYTELNFFSEHRYSIELTKTALFLTNDMSKQAVRCYIRAYRSICEIAYQASRAYKPPQEIDNELNIFYMKKLSMISSITQILKSLKEMPELKNYALILSKHVKNISEACEIYDLMIEETKDLSTKIEIIGDYADYCLEWGRYEKATTLLQRKLGLEKNSFENYMITIKKLTAVALQQKQSLERYHQNLSNWTRLPEEDTFVDQYLQELELIIPEQ